jgi:tRNA threonylcarbamoyladenosine biosynthesis protein TsaB
MTSDESKEAPAEGSSSERNILLIDTAETPGSIGLFDGSTVVARRSLDGNQKHGRDFAPSFASMMRELGRSPKEIDAVFVNVGPGSYTGLRVGVASAKTIAYLNRAPIVAVDAPSIYVHAAIAAFESKASGGGSEPNSGVEGFRFGERWKRICPLIDGQRGMVYSASSGVDPSPLVQPEVSLISIADRITAFCEGDLAIGPGVVRYRVDIPDRFRLDDLAVDGLAALSRIGARRLEAGMVADLWTLEPSYLRPSAAEEKWRARRSPRA